MALTARMATTDCADPTGLANSWTEGSNRVRVDGAAADRTPDGNEFCVAEQG